ncbi:MAG: methyltransferase domain-containing protein [Streptosporangiales bacterium]|nr:methyltransferase domain-containing protein [Streptosporangiales bacterium]
MDWQPHAARLASETTHPVSRWRPIVASLPRHVFVPRWWTWSAPGDGFGSEVWDLNDGRADEQGWLKAAYADRSLVTQVGPLHADHAEPGQRPSGMPTSSATLPRLVAQMFRHAHIDDGAEVLDVGTGSGYGCAMLACRLGDIRVTSVDVDPYLTTAAAERLDEIGLHPKVVTCDATGPLPGTYDRIVATVSVRPIPASWLAALRPGGRLVTTISDTALIITADRTDDGGADGKVEWDRAGFMHTRTGADYPPRLVPELANVHEAEGDVSHGRYPVVNVVEAWELWSMLGVVAPGIQHHYQQDSDGGRTAWMIHPDGSWARASSPDGESPTVHQGGPRRLWDVLDDLRHTWLRDGSLPVYGARVRITPDGAIHLRRGRWQATLSA